MLLYLLLISYQACKLESAAHFGRLFNKLWCGTICMFVVVDEMETSAAKLMCVVQSIALMSYIVAGCCLGQCYCLLCLSQNEK